MDDPELLLKKYRKKPLALPADFPVKLDYGREDIKKIIPHREPFLLVDSIIGVDLAKALIIGKRFIDPAEPLFKGHFPGFPVYPGALQLEMTGQLGLCLYHFMRNDTLEIKGANEPLNVRATRVLGGHYLAPVLPGKEVLITAMRLEQDDFFGIIIGQVISGDTVCSVSISEICFVDP